MISPGSGGEGAEQAGPPKFTTAFSSLYEVQEGQGCHMEAKLTPSEDPDMKIEWFKDGKALPTGHRFRTFNDFGIVILDVLYCYAEDSGTYECKATNKHGTDSISCKIACSEKSSLILTPQVCLHPKGIGFFVSNDKKYQFKCPGLLKMWQDHHQSFRIFTV